LTVRKESDRGLLGGEAKGVAKKSKKVTMRHKVGRNLMGGRREKKSEGGELPHREENKAEGFPKTTTVKRERQKAAGLEIAGSCGG